MLHSRKLRFRAVLLLVTALVFTLIGPRTDSTESQASTISTAVVNPSSQGGIFGYAKIVGSDTVVRTKNDQSPIAVKHVESLANDDQIVDRLGNQMSDQMSALINRTGGTAATASNVTSSELASLNQDLRSSGQNTSFVDIVTKITFHLQSGTLPASVTSASDALYYVEQAISRHPMLCCLFTMIILDQSKTTLTVYSPIAVDNLLETTAEYMSTLDAITTVPKRNTSMTDEDKVLYLHDEIVALTEYSVGRRDTYALDYTPVGAMVYNLSVCQGYAAVFNQAARQLGLTSYVIDSSTHAWNAVRIRGSWYYVDTTWDDTRPYGTEKDYVNHKYVLINKTGAADTAFLSGHTVTTEYSSHFGNEVIDHLGSDFGSYFPKTEGITSQMGFLGGYFYYSKDNRLYKWDRGSRKGEITGIPTATSRRIAVMDGIVYISGSDGMYQSDASVSTLNRADSTPFIGMYEAANKLYVSTGGPFYVYHSVATPSIGPTTAPGTTAIPIVTVPPTSASASPGASLPPGVSASPTPTSTYHGIPTVPPTPTATIFDPTLVTPTPSPGTTVAPAPTPTDSTPTTFNAPGKTKIKTIQNIKTRSVYLKWKKVTGTTQYQVQYSPSKSFTTKQIRTSLTSSVTIANLIKKKTYYFRVRAVKIKWNGVAPVRKYGKWSAKKKVKIRK
ncbi:MAG: fibronectin type III domain-containing protein [Eubacterium sp.]|nr:fibronectin type III domain-containing protein [Eubacterium sp.]